MGTTKSGHVWFECECNQTGCMFCDGGLGSCTVCGGFEGTLTHECCGYALDEHTLNAVYKGGLDYVHGKWVVAPKHIADDTHGAYWTWLIEIIGKE